MDYKQPEEPLNYIEKARQLTIEWAKANSINLLRIDLITPSVRVSKKFSVWLLFDTDKQIKEYEENTTIQKIKDKYSNTLKELSCPFEYLEGILFFTDSEENAQRFLTLEPLDE